MKNRAAIRYGRHELAHKFHDYFPKEPAKVVAEAAMNLYRYCARQDIYANYDQFNAVITSLVPSAPVRKIDGLFKKLFPMESLDEKPNTKPHSVGSSKSHIKGLHFPLERSYTETRFRRELD